MLPIALTDRLFRLTVAGVVDGRPGVALGRTLLTRSVIAIRVAS
ncbi:MAG: hypothetical protein ABIY55_27525 [Kofleriaceae bacterium]